MSSNSFDSRDTLEVGGKSYEIHRLDALQSKFDIARLPYSIKVLLENALRLEDDFQRLNTRAGQVVERFGVVDAAVGEGVGQALAFYQEAIADLD